MTNEWRKNNSRRCSSSKWMYRQTYSATTWFNLDWHQHCCSCSVLGFHRWYFSLCANIVRSLTERNQSFRCCYFFELMKETEGHRARERVGDGSSIKWERNRNDRRRRWRWEITYIPCPTGVLHCTIVIKHHIGLISNRLSKGVHFNQRFIFSASWPISHSLVLLFALHHRTTRSWSSHSFSSLISDWFDESNW